jgi:carboxypeptidase family protein/uncharacterized protein DUF4129
VRRALVAALLVATAAVPARADNPVIHVRARLRLDLDAVERVPGGLWVRGSLRDDLTDEPIPGRTVAISVEGDHGFWHYAEPTGPDGAFRWRVPLPLGTYRMRIAAGGDADYVPPAALFREIDVGRRTLTVTMEVPARIAAHAPSLHVVVEAHETDGIGPPRAFDGAANVYIGPQHKRETLVTLQNGRGETDLYGPFGRAGERITVHTFVDDDDVRNGANAMRTVTLTSPTAVSLAVGADKVAPDKLVYVTGELHDDDGPMGGAAVVLGLENGADVATFTTDDNGRYSGWLRGRDLPTGTAFLEARFRPREEWREASVSPTVPVEVLPAPPITVWPYLLSPALTLVAALVFWALRDRRWLRVFKLRRRARRLAAIPPPAPGLTESRRGILASLRRPDHGLSGVVVDAADDRPLPTATLVARTGDGQSHAATVDERGRFVFEELAAGPLVVEIAAPGYVGERFSRTLPHRGELRNARVRLVPVRARIFAAWRRAAQPLYPTPKAAETMTPRELLAHVGKRRMLLPEPLVALTALVESSVWGGSAPSPEDLREAERLAAQLKADS